MNKIIMADRTVVHCPTLEWAKKVLTIAYKTDKDRYQQFLRYWDSYCIDTCYCLTEDSYCGMGFFEEHHYNIITAEQFLKMNGKRRSLRL